MEFDSFQMELIGFSGTYCFLMEFIGISWHGISLEFNWIH